MEPCRGRIALVVLLKQKECERVPARAIRLAPSTGSQEKPAASKSARALSSESRDRQPRFSFMYRPVQSGRFRLRGTAPAYRTEALPCVDSTTQAGTAAQQPQAHGNAPMAAGMRRRGVDELVFSGHAPPPNARDLDNGAHHLRLPAAPTSCFRRD
jgi:hypothetical protein